VKTKVVFEVICEDQEESGYFQNYHRLEMPFNFFLINAIGIWKEQSC
jgi:hypothetical protein